VGKFLLCKELDVNARGNKGQTALFEAAGHGHEAVVQLLIDAGADVAIKQIQGWKALLRLIKWRV
jgi:ankyrin repeat protein